MATTDSNGIVKVEMGDDIAPLHPVFNALATSVSNAISARSSVWPVANVAARTAKVNEIGIGNITATKPLLVWRGDAPIGRNLEYTLNGSAWFYYESNAVGISDTGWITIPYEAGYTLGTGGPLRYRIREGVVYIQGGATGSFTSGSYKTVATLPEVARPSADQVRAGAAGSSGRAGLYEVNKTGEIKFAFNAWGSSSAPTWMAMNCSYPLG